MTTLLEEITTGPLSAEIAPFLQVGDGASIAYIVEILNRKDINAYGKITNTAFAIWAAETGQRAVFEDESKNPISPFRSIALTLLDLQRGGLDVKHLDIGSAKNIAMINAWKQGGKMTQAQYDSLFALAAINISRAEQLGMSVSENDISRLIYNDDGTRAI